MAAVSKPLASTSSISHIRVFDVRRDLEAVADLVELCFASTLDTDGRNYLRRMRYAAKQPTIIHWASFATEWAGVPLSGYVWQEGDRLVGNVSLIPYHVGKDRFYLIANVAVHPEYRRRGIARDLTESAVLYARKKGAPAVWLHVREENVPAVLMYQSMGFVERAHRTSWFSKSEPFPDSSSERFRITIPAKQDWNIQRSWLLSNYPPEITWHMPFKLDALRPGLLGAIVSLFYGFHIRQWAILCGDKLLGALAWQHISTRTNALWLATPEEVDGDVVCTLLGQARRSASSNRTLMLDFPAHRSEEAIQAAGFSAHQTLIWMEKKFSESG